MYEYDSKEVLTLILNEIIFYRKQKKKDMVSYRYVNFAKNWLKEKKDVS
jgi:hypothetical protein